MPPKEFRMNRRLLLVFIMELLLIAVLPSLTRSVTQDPSPVGVHAVVSIGVTRRRECY